MTPLNISKATSMATLAALCGAVASSACGSEHGLVHHHSHSAIDHLVLAATAADAKTYALQSVPAPHLCLAAKGGVNADGTRVVLATCKDGSRAQTWQRTGDTFRLYGDKCLDVIGGRDRDGTQLQIWTCGEDNDNQRWATNNHELRWADHTRCAGLFDDTLTAGEVPQMFRCHFQLSAQQWRLKAVAPGRTATPTPPVAAVPAASSQKPPATSTATPAQGAAVTCQGLGTWPAGSAQFEAEVLTRINQNRAKGASCGTQGSFSAKGPLVANDKLTCLARAFAKDMSDNHYFSHTDRAGRSPFDRMKAAGIAYRAAAENIAEGQRTPAEVVDSWMKSDGHCANIMGPYQNIGIGFFNFYWVQDFATFQ